MAGDDAVVAVFASPSGGGTCGIARYPSTAGGPTGLDVEEFVLSGYWTELPGGYATDRVGIAAGDAVRITYAEASAETDGDFWNAIYVIPAEEDLYTVQCTTDDPDGRPADDWLSIAETFEFLPDEEGALPSGDPVERPTDDAEASVDGPPGGHFGPDIGQGRLERPADGFAITFPSDWDIEVVSEAGNEWIDQHAANPQGAAVITELVWAGDESLNEQCFVSDASRYAASPPAWTSLEQAVEDEAASMARWPRVVEHASDYLDLPAGRAGLIEVRYQEGSVGQMYIFRSGERWLTLHCEAYVRPTDDWLAIAETFEFLPPQ
jgi:hypothetical protein